MTAIQGAGDPRGLSVTVEYGLWKVLRHGDTTTSSGTLEGALAKMAPDAPAEYVAHAAAVIEGILGVGE